VKKGKVCRTCGEWKPWSRLVKAKHLPDGYQSYCKDCKQAKARAEYTTLGARESFLRRNYGITHDDYLELLAAVNNECEICGAGEGASKRNNKWTHLSVDHVHETGKIRGILCDRCNPGLGMFRDDPDLLEKAAAYLRARGSKPVPTDEEGIGLWKEPWTSPITGKTGPRWKCDVPEVAHKVYRSKRAALVDAKLAIRKRT
jgi:hypothetical protein